MWDANLREVQPERLFAIFSQIVCTLTDEQFDIAQVQLVEQTQESTEPIFAQDITGVPNLAPSERDDYDCEAAARLVDPAIGSASYQHKFVYVSNRRLATLPRQYLRKDG